ncbi:MAG: histidine kinase [Acidobacteriota bacterium]|nr:histidine kinase [Acidobacteriota bacterium]
MRRLFSRARLLKAGVIFSAWTVYGMLSAWQSHYWYAFTRTPMSWPDAIRYELTYAYAWAACSPLILWAGHRFRFERRHWARTLLVHFVLMTAIVVFTKTAFDYIGYMPTSPFRDFTWDKWTRSVVATFDMGPLMYGVVVLIQAAATYYNDYRAGLIKASQLQTQLVHAQLQALRMQLHPHFLFNTLHTITALMHEDPEAAERTIARLAELLRFFLASSAIHEVPLEEELRVLDLYLEIERARFEERLRVYYEIPDELREALVPSLILQPLIENSIRHGLGKQALPGIIRIVAERRADTLILCVTDNGEGLKRDPLKPVHQGMGLGITRGRLESLYGPRQSLVLRNLPERGVEACMSLPFRTQEAIDQEKNHAELQSVDR